MVEVPVATAVTRPLLLTVATFVSEDVHAPEVAAVPLPVSWEVPFTQTVEEPVIVGKALIVTNAVFWQPLLSV